MLQPLFFPLLGGCCLLIAIASLIFPESIIGKKDEYLKFLFFSIGAFWVLYMIGRFFAGYRWEGLFHSAGALLVMLYVWLTFTHLIYPFKEVKRSKTLKVVSLVILAVGIVVTAIAWIGMAMSEM